MPEKFFVGVGAYIEKGGEVLIVKRHSNEAHHAGIWTVPTGRLEKGEDAISGVKREVKEEVGLEIAVLHPFSVWKIIRDDTGEEVIGISFLAKWLAGEVRLHPEELMDYKWIEPYKLLEIETLEGVKNEFKEYLELRDKLFSNPKG